MPAGISASAWRGDIAANVRSRYEIACFDDVFAAAKMLVRELETHPMKTSHRLRAWLVVLVSFVAASSAFAASFSAEIVDTENGKVRTGSFNVQDQNYRFEISDNGETLVVTCDAATGTMRMLVPTQKIYFESVPDEALSRLANPFACYAFYARTKSVQPEGEETIGGVKCTKRVVVDGEQVFVIGWWSEEFAFPLKVEVPLLRRTVELRNIKRGPQDAGLFSPPVGYTLRPGPGQEPPAAPEWAGQIAKAPVVNPPFERTLATDAIIRLRPQAGRKIVLQASCPGKDECTVVAVGFKGGRPTEDLSGNTCTINPDGPVTMTFSRGPAAIDEIVVRAIRGSVKIKASWAGSPGVANTGVGSEPANPPEATASLDAPETADMASRFDVLWTGPANTDDYISVARPSQPAGSNLGIARIREGNPVKLWAPSEPGEFELRYVVARGAKVLATRAIRINAVSATVDATGPVKEADWVDVAWTGPGYAGDFVSIAKPGSAAGASVSQARLNQSSPLKVRVPSDAGEYEVRYVLGRGAKVLAKTQLTVTAVSGSVQAPATAVAGSDFQVRWTGPGYAEDFIALARPDQSPRASIATRRTAQGNPATLRAPKEPGVYEVRYMLGRGSRPLGTATITVTAAPAKP
jgi:hypothetical protein